MAVSIHARLCRGDTGARDVTRPALDLLFEQRQDVLRRLVRNRERLDAELLLGFSEADAQRCAAQLGWSYRVGQRDGESFAVTMDYSLQRVTVTVADDIVTAITVG